MRSLPLAFVVVVTLLSPAATLAAPAAPTGVATAAPPAPSAGARARYFEIRGLVLGNLRLEVSGKLSIDGNQLSASAGCNLIGGAVIVDGDTVTIVGPTYMTEMACPGTNGDAEAMLIKILALATFKITATAWIADGGQIVTEEIPMANPGPNATRPDEPISTGVPTIVDPAPSGQPANESCPPTPSGNTSTSVDGGPVVGSGGSGSGGGSSATAGTGVTEPGATADIGTDPGIGKPVDPCLDYAVGSSQLGAGNAVPPKAIDAAAESQAQDAATASALFLPLLMVLGVALLLGIQRFPRGLPTRR
jgi:heat shock protein HslJ